jgi:hypothetical protein
MTEFWAAIIGAIVGAVVGGAISLGLQMMGASAAKKQRDEDHKLTQSALAHAVLFKMIRLLTNLWNFHDHLEASFAQAAKHDPHLEPWQFVVPIANHPKHVEFATAEMALVLSMKDNDLFNELVSLDTVHNSLVDLFVLYADRRRELTDKFSAKMDGMVGETMIPSELLAFVRPRMVELNHLLEGMRGQAKNDFDQCERCVTKLQALLKKQLGLNYSLTTARGVPGRT